MMARRPARPQYHGDLEGDDTLARRIARATLITRVFVLVAIAMGIAVLYVLISVSSATNKIVTKVSDKQNSNAELFESIESLALEIRSCTDPAGVCAKRGQKATGDAIASINLYGLYVVTCADQPGQQTESELRACANRLAARDQRP